MNSYVIRGGRLVDPAGGIDEDKDVYIKNGVIEALLRPGEIVAGAETVDAKGMWVTPGLIDLHVHLREPGFEWKETIQSGSEAAALGGFTTICAMPNTSPVNDCAEVTEFIFKRSRETGLVNVRPIGAVSRGLKGKEMAPLSELRDAGCVAFSDDGEPVYDSGMMRRALEWCRMLDAVISCHEEDKCLSCGGSMNESYLSTKLGLIGWPKVAEEVMIARDIELARYTRGRAHICHVSTARGVELVRRAKNDGIRITAEVTPHHLTLTQETVGDYDTNAKMSPPLREEEDLEALRAGLADGTIDAVASDHAPHELDKKRVEFAQAAYGILGLQTSVPLILSFVKSGVLSRLRAIEAFTSGPARAFGLDAGSIRKGAAADVAVINPQHEWRFSKEIARSLSLNSPFLGRDLAGRAEHLFVSGSQKVSHGQLIEREKHG